MGMGGHKTKQNKPKNTKVHKREDRMILNNLGKEFTKVKTSHLNTNSFHRCMLFGNSMCWCQPCLG